MNDRSWIQRNFAQVPANRYLGFRLISHSAQEAVVEMEVSPDQVQETGVVHGGLLGGLADTAAVYVLYPHLAADQSMASIEFKLNFLRPATVDRGSLTAHATLLRRGRKVGVCDVELTQADVVVAKGLFTYLFMDKTEWPEEVGETSGR
jgi:uncharacterized protein (TIGR00369 family)